MPNPAPVTVDRLHVFAGSRLRDQRERAGFTQESLAQLVDTTRESINAWEGGRAVPSATKLARLATVLNCTPNDFFVTRDLTRE